MKFTEQYFLDEVRRLREQMGTNSFWQLSEEQRDRMLGGLTIVYLNIFNDDGTSPSHVKIQEWCNIFEAVMLAYNQRELYLNVTLPLKQLAAI